MASTSRNSEEVPDPERQLADKTVVAAFSKMIQPQLLPSAAPQAPLAARRAGVGARGKTIPLAGGEEAPR